MRYPLSLDGVQPGRYQFNISDGVLMRIVGQDYSTGIYGAVSGSTQGSAALGYILQNEAIACPDPTATAGYSTFSATTNKLVTDANKVLAQSIFGGGLSPTAFLASPNWYANTGEALTSGAVYDPNLDVTAVTDKLGWVNPSWWGGRVFKDQVQVFNYEKSQELKVGFSLDYTIVDASTKRVVAQKVGANFPVQSWLNPEHAHTITFTAGLYNGLNQTFNAATVRSPPSGDALIDAFQQPANVYANTPATSTGTCL